MSSTILVVEDEERIRQFLQRGLGFEGYRVEAAADGNTALEIARDNPPDLVLLDLMLPGIDGLEVCRRLRAVSDVPILMLTAKEAIEDRVAGLDAGADDYLVKPFGAEQLEARIRAVLRRLATATPDASVTVGGLTVNPVTREVTVDGIPVELSRKEFDLLYLLAQRAGEVVTKREILAEVWRQSYGCLLYTSPSPRDGLLSRMPSSA